MEKQKKFLRPRMFSSSGSACPLLLRKVNSKKLTTIFASFYSMSPIEDDDLLNEGSPPSAPIGLEVASVEGTSVTLKWKEPKKDGGAPIKEYLIEYKSETDEEWNEGPRIKPKKFYNETVNELQTKTKYQFRVSAVNRNGMGDSSDATEPKLLKPSKSPPEIDRSQFPEGNLSCKVNSQLVLEVNVEGIPAPSTTWLRNDAELSTGDGIKVVHNPNVAKLMFIPALRPLSGKYTLKAKNQVRKMLSKNSIHF